MENVSSKVFQFYIQLQLGYQCLISIFFIELLNCRTSNLKAKMFVFNNSNKTGNLILSNTLFRNQVVLPIAMNIDNTLYFFYTHHDHMLESLSSSSNYFKTSFYKSCAEMLTTSEGK